MTVRLLAVTNAVTWRCAACNRVLCEYVPLAGLWLRKRCDRCNAWNELQIPDSV